MNLKYTVHSAVISRSVEEVTFSGGILHLHSATGKSLRNGITWEDGEQHGEAIPIFEKPSFSQLHLAGSSITLATNKSLRKRPLLRRNPKKRNKKIKRDRCRKTLKFMEINKCLSAVASKFVPSNPFLITTGRPFLPIKANIRIHSQHVLPNICLQFNSFGWVLWNLMDIWYQTEQLLAKLVKVASSKPGFSKHPTFHTQPAGLKPEVHATGHRWAQR